uniref:NADH-ubiquinone oxidoreductase chain 2 n=1 Tax=Eclysippe vanelli TaxID=479700 RepID=B3TJY2_ECLVA|nr:NADH dehydrogenase subunit 2 [Eclysippe vanelli]
MISIIWKPYSMVMFLVVSFGVVLSISSDNWISIWLGMEINLYAFVPLMLLEMKNQEKEAAVKYFISQSVPSALLLLSFIMYSGEALMVSSILFLGLLMKMGLAPVHFWLPSVMGSVSWGVCWALSTIQKVAPVMIIFYSNSFSPLMTVFCAGVSSIVSGVGGMNQTLMRVLLAYSSIGHMGWVLAGSMVCKMSAWFYFFSYMFIISGLFFFLAKVKLSSGDFIKKIGGSYWLVVLIMFLFFSLGGLPPFLGFYPKMMVLGGLVNDSFYILSVVMIIGSVLNLYYYLKVVFISVLSSPYMSYNLSFFWQKNEQVSNKFYFYCFLYFSSFIGEYMLY